MVHEIDPRAPAPHLEPRSGGDREALCPYELVYDVRRGYEAAAPRRRRRREDAAGAWEARRERR